MSVSCFQVIAMTCPRTYEMRQSVGSYESKELAEKVADVVQQIYQNQIPGGIHVVIEQNLNVYSIKSLDDQELIRIANLQFRVEDPVWF
jgi:hypothetical protein